MYETNIIIIFRGSSRSIVNEDKENMQIRNSKHNTKYAKEN